MNSVVIGDSFFITTAHVHGGVQFQNDLTGLYVWKLIF